MRFAWADPPFFGHCGTYGHFHGDNSKPYDGKCWDDGDSLPWLVKWLQSEFPDGWVLGTEPSSLHAVVAPDLHIGFWGRTYHPILPTTVQETTHVFVRHGGRDRFDRPIVRDWITGTNNQKNDCRGARPDYVNDWILSMLGYEAGDEVVDLFPESDGMARATARFDAGIIPTTPLAFE